MDKETSPDEMFGIMFDGHQIVIRRWFDSGNLSVWRRWSEDYVAIMKDLATRHGGQFRTVERYESWYFSGVVASAVIEELNAICAGRP